MIRTAIVDDEPLARDGIRIRLQHQPDIEIVGEAGDGPSAVDLILETRPELLFLDVQMPGMDGFAVLERVAPQHLPVVVFITAHDDYAIRAFEAHALDYLLKPFTNRRWQHALDRIRETLHKEDLAERHAHVLALLEGTPPGPSDARGKPSGWYGSHFTVKDGGRFVLVREDEIDWVEAARNYVRLHTGKGAFLLRRTMTSMESRLDPRRFARIHRSTIVNLERVREIRPEWHGDFEVELAGGIVLRMSRVYKDRVLKT